MTTEVETHSIQTEQALLGAFLMYSGAMALVDGILEEECFFERVHQQIYSVCRQLYTMGKTVNPLTVAPFIPAKIEIANGVTARQYVARLAAEAATMMQVRDYARVVRDYADNRRCWEIGQQLEPRAGDDPMAKASAAMDALSDLIGSRETAATAGVDMEAATVGAIDATANAYKRDGMLSGAPYGFRELDYKTLGAQPGELVIIAGRPGSGKTTLALAAARNQAKAGLKVRIESLEMSATSLTHRLIADELFDDYRMTYHSMRSGRFREAEFTEMLDASKRIAKLPIRIEQPIGMTMPQLAARVRQWKRRNGLDILYVDHLGYVKLPGRDNQVKELGDVTKALKALARELEIPVALLCQLSRGVEGREDKRPTLSDLRASGNIEEDADAVLMVYRESYYLEKREPRPGTPEYIVWQDAMEAALNKMLVIVEKNRSGPVGGVPLYCDISCNAVRDSDYEPRQRRAAAQPELTL